MTVWQPIETAPIGTMVLMCSMAATEARDWCFVDWFANQKGKPVLHGKLNPTHWMPLPEPPK